MDEFFKIYLILSKLIKRVTLLSDNSTYANFDFEGELECHKILVSITHLILNVLNLIPHFYSLNFKNFVTLERQLFAE